MSQMVGSQAVTNVLMGRYAAIIEPVREYARGIYGRPPSPMDPDVREKALVGMDGGQTEIVGRPEAWGEPELPSAAREIDGISSDLDDILTYALYPQTGRKWLRIKHGLDPMPEDMKPPEDGAHMNAPLAPAASPPRKSHRARAFNVYIDGDAFFVEVDPVSSAPPGQTAPESEPPAAIADTDARPDAALARPGESIIEAPMPGLILRHEVEVGDVVQAGETVLILEAMKMENSLPAPVAGAVRSLPFGVGDKVSRGDVLAVINPS